MNRSLKAYAIIEALIGRRLAWRTGRWLYAGARRDLVNNPHVNGEYALQTWVIDACARVGEKDAVFFDVGANLGEWSLSIAEKLSGSSLLRGRIVAFEPAPAQWSTLTKRLGQIGDTVHVACHKEALSHTPGKGSLLITGEDTGTSSLSPSGESEAPGTVRVPIDTVDAVMEREMIDHITFLKIDTEGNDLNVILGAQGAMARHAIDLIQFEYNWRWINFDHSLMSVFKTIQPLEYTLGRLSEDGIELYESWHPELDRFMETNFVLLGPRLKEHLPASGYSFDSSNVAIALDAS